MHDIVEAPIPEVLSPTLTRENRNPGGLTFELGAKERFATWYLRDNNNRFAREFRQIRDFARVREHGYAYHEHTLPSSARIVEGSITHEYRQYDGSKSPDIPDRTEEMIFFKVGDAYVATNDPEEPTIYAALQESHGPRILEFNKAVFEACVAEKRDEILRGESDVVTVEIPDFSHERSYYQRIHRPPTDDFDRWNLDVDAQYLAGFTKLRIAKATLQKYITQWQQEAEAAARVEQLVQEEPAPPARPPHFEGYRAHETEGSPRVPHFADVAHTEVLPDRDYLTAAGLRELAQAPRGTIILGPHFARETAKMAAIIGRDWASYDANQGIPPGIASQEEFMRIFHESYESTVQELELPVVENSSGFLWYPNTKGYDSGLFAVGNGPATFEAHRRARQGEFSFPISSTHIHPLEVTGRPADYEELDKQPTWRMSLKEQIAFFVTNATAYLRAARNPGLNHIFQRLQFLENLTNCYGSPGDIAKLLSSPELSSSVATPAYYVNNEVIPGKICYMVKRNGPDRRFSVGFFSNTPEERRMGRQWKLAQRKAIRALVALAKANSSHMSSDDEIARAFLAPIAKLYRQYGVDMYFGDMPPGKIPDEGVDLQRIAA